jgi:hypothetical protein
VKLYVDPSTANKNNNSTPITMLNSLKYFEVSYVSKVIMESRLLGENEGSSYMTYAEVDPHSYPGPVEHTGPH